MKPATPQAQLATGVLATFRQRLGRHLISLAVAAAVVIFAAALAVLANTFLWQTGDSPETSGPSGGQPSAAASHKEQASPAASSAEQAAAVPVAVTSPRTMVFEQRVDVAGTVLAKRYAFVSARIPGTLDAIFVEEGDRVEAGKTKLFQTDSVKLAQAVAIAQEQVTVAECAVREKEALLEKTLVGQQVAEADLARYRDLAKRNAIARQVVEHQEAQCRQFDADVRHVQTLIELAKAQLEQARLNLKIAEKDFADSLVVAPVSGRVSLKLKEPGEMAAAGTPVLRIDDLSLVELSVFVPSEYFPNVVVGESKMRATVGGKDLGALVVTYKSPTVEPKLRTFQVKALLESPPPEVVPGCLAQVSLIIGTRQGIAVPVPAVQVRGGKNVVFVVENDKAKAIPVEIGWEQEGWREIRSSFSPLLPVITMGQVQVEDGTPVRVIKEETTR